MRTNDRELAVRIVDQVERGVRREGLTGPEGGTEARRRFHAACPWPGEFDTERAGHWRRSVEGALTRLFAPMAPAVEVEVRPGLVVPAELEAWLAARRVKLRERDVQPSEGGGA